VSAKVEYNIPGDANKIIHPPSKPVWFASLDAAKSAPFPDGCKSAVVTSDEGNLIGTKFGSTVDWYND
jgi:hypothetical protein